MPTTEDASKSVAPCYLFKSQLQQFVQKAGYSTPMYDSVKEGPAHKPTFRSTVTVNNVRYDSLTGFFNRKAAEQSAAEVALSELNKSKSTLECNSKPVTETGLCKNFLQEYAQKMNYSMPVYRFEKSNRVGRAQSVIHSVEINGVKYIGAAAQNKKEAEIKAARTALLAIQSSTAPSHSPQDDSVHSVVPLLKRAVDVGPKPQETPDALKVKKKRLKKKKKRTCGGNRNGKGQDNTIPMVRSPNDKVGLGGVNDSLIKLSDANVLATKMVPECGESKNPSGDGSIWNLSHIEGNHPGQGKEEVIPMICSPSDKVGVSDSIVLATGISSPENGKCLTLLGDDSTQNVSYLDGKHNCESEDNNIPMVEAPIDEVEAGGVVRSIKLSSPEAGECLTPPTGSVQNSSYPDGIHKCGSKDNSIPMFDSFMKLFDPQVLGGEMSSPEWAESLTPLGAGSISMVLGTSGADDIVTKQSDPKVLKGKVSSPEWAQCLTPLENSSYLESLRFTENTANSILNHFGDFNKLPAYRCDGLDSLIEIANGGPVIGNWSGSSHDNSTCGQL